MKFLKTNVILILLLAFVLDSSAQSQILKITWKNLLNKYESFYDIQPSILNDGKVSIFYSPYPSITLFYWDEEAGKWRDTNRFLCYVGTKFSTPKLKPRREFKVNLDKHEWDMMTIDDNMTPKFKSFPNYPGKGKYKLKLSFGLQKSDLSQEAFSPEFEVVEKDFKQSKTSAMSHKRPFLKQS